MTASRQARLCSIVIPLHNEADGLAELHRRIRAVMGTLALPCELVMVDDGSRDGTAGRVRELRATDPAVKLVRLSRNFGHQAALTAGLDHATGDVVVTMDGDLQHPPELIPALYAQWQAGAEVVHTRRVAEPGRGWLKRTTSAAFYAIFRRLAAIPLPPDSPDFRLLDRRAVEALRRLPERARFVRGLTVWIGFTQVSVPMDVAARRYGEAGYTAAKMLRLSMDALTGFSAAPLRLAALTGALLSLGAGAYGVYAIWIRVFTDRGIPGWASVLCVTAFFSGLQLLGLGILGEYLARVFDEVKQRPVYLVAEALGFDTAGR